MRDRWHVLKEPGTYTLARRLPVRFDVAVTTTLPKMRKERLAQQVRQDMWRALQKVRGFSPVVRVVETEAGCEVTAGGSVEAKSFPKARMEEVLAAILEDPERRARWGRWAVAMVAALVLPVLIAGGAVAGPAPVPVKVPSGREVALMGVLLDDTPGALWARFRFVAPGLGDAASAEATAQDMDDLCAHVAVPYLEHNKIQPARVVISLSDREIEFGKNAPDAVQYFEAYTLDGDTCVWEGL